MGRPRQFEADVALDQAVGVFRDKGYAATTPQDLVDRLGIGKGSLYNAFTSKHALFEQALRRYGERRVAGLAKALEGPGPVRERLRTALERIADSDQGGRGCLAVNSAAELGGADAVVTAMVTSVFDRMEQAFLATVEEGQRNGEISTSRDPRELASLLLATAIGMSVTAKTGESHRMQRVISAVMASL
jgi:TetR/AcrR family transcriptional regulator, transcriptional repressor for nem operon